MNGDCAEIISSLVSEMAMDNFFNALWIDAFFVYIL